MSDGVISKIQLPDENTYDIIDSTSGYITGMTILSYGSSTWDNFIEAYNSNKVVYCRASSNSNPASGSQTRLAFMAYVNNAATPTEVEFQYYRSVSTHTASQQGDQVFVYKLNKTNGWSVTTREASVKVVAGTGLGGTYSNGTMTLTGPTNVSDLTNDSGFVTTDEKLKVTVDDTNDLYPVLTSSSSDASTKKYSNLLHFTDRIDGRQLRIGGTDEDSTIVPGVLRLYNAAGGSVSLKFDDSTPYNRSITIPNKAGANVTLAVTDDIPTSTSTPTANEVAEFDSNAYMNSTDMTSQEVSDFVDDLSYESEVATVISDIVDYVVEQGKSGDTYYRKWNSGNAEMWLNTTQNVSISNAYSSLYQGTWTWTFPFEFVNTPTVSCSHFKWGTGAAWGTVSGFTGGESCTLRGIDCVSRASGSTVIQAYAFGKWK